ncbi:MAG: hypothetical protein R3C56_37545 [Pirellulaceae bacterium]
MLWRDGTRWVHRFGPQAGKLATAEAISQMACQLRVGSSSGVETLHYQTSSRPALQPGEVEIEVIAAGLNFSDVMKVLGLYPGAARWANRPGCRVLRTHRARGRGEPVASWR